MMHLSPLWIKSTIFSMSVIRFEALSNVSVVRYVAGYF